MVFTSAAHTCWTIQFTNHINLLRREKKNVQQELCGLCGTLSRVSTASLLNKSLDAISPIPSYFLFLIFSPIDEKKNTFRNCFAVEVKNQKVPYWLDLYYCYDCCCYSYFIFWTLWKYRRKYLLSYM